MANAKTILDDIVGWMIWVTCIYLGLLLIGPLAWVI